MAKRVRSGPRGPDQEESADGRSVVDLADARVRLRSKNPSNETLIEELDEVRSLLDQGLSTEARARLTSLISAARSNPTVLARARCALSAALEMQGRYRESLTAVAMYETPESQAKLDPDTVCTLRVQIALAHNYNGDPPKAISILKALLKEFSENGTDAK